MENNELVVKKINEIIVLEQKLQMLKEVENQIKQEKEDLRQAMIKVDMKKWEMPNGTKITLIEDGEDEVVQIKKIDEVKFAEENLEFHNAFMEHKKQYEDKRNEYATITTEIKPGRKGYVRITLPKVSTNE